MQHTWMPNIKGRPNGYLLTGKFVVGLAGQSNCHYSHSGHELDDRNKVAKEDWVCKHPERISH